MKLKIKRIDKSLPLPEYKTKGAVGLDLYARTTTIIKPGGISYIPLNVALDIPEDCWILMAARSSAHKLGIIQANGIGIGDSDFCGDNDEYLFPALNYTNKDVIIEKGTRIAQIIPLNFRKVSFEEAESFGNDDRGGIGSTGVK